MASSILTLKRVASSTMAPSIRPLINPTRRHISSRSPVDDLRGHVQQLGQSVWPSMLTLASSFYPSDDRNNFPPSCRGGTGIFINPKLIVTSAHVVGRVSPFYEVEKPELNHGSILHKSEIASTVAHTANGIALKTRPLAVNFGNDVAVLEVVDLEGSLFPHCELAKCLPDKENILISMFHGESLQFEIMMGNVRATGQKTVRAKAPWPIDDELGWIEHEWWFYGRGDPPLKSALFSSTGKVTGSITKLTGSPWFNLHGEVVGIASWEVRDEPAKFSVGFAVPPPRIRSVLEYAKTKGPEDPIVMDRWINVHVIHGV